MNTFLQIEKYILTPYLLPIGLMAGYSYAVQVDVLACVLMAVIFAIPAIVMISIYLCTKLYGFNVAGTSMALIWRILCVILMGVWAAAESGNSKRYVFESFIIGIVILMVDSIMFGIRSLGVVTTAQVPEEHFELTQL